jgi:Carboxypeptidase regulatory-like domain/TonB dependent receptor
MRFVRARFVFSLVALLCLQAVAAFSQTASLNGTITDTSGALVQQATITVRNTATNATRSVEASSSGVYSVPNLDAGQYEVSVAKEGFRPVKFDNIKLTVDQALTLNAKLDVGSNAEQVTVEGTAAPVDTTDAQLSNVVEHQQMTELPLILRDPYQLVLLSPGVTQSDGMGGISANGARERNNNFMLDGADNNDADVPGSLGGITAQNPDSTEEFRIITNNFAPEYGRNNGAIIDVITRSGTNRWHGNAFYFGRWDALGSRDYFNHQIDPETGSLAPKNPYVRNLYGASLGGPIVKDKTFFFVNYQGDRFVTNLTNNSTVPTQAFKTGIFTYTNPTPPCPGCPLVSQALDITGNAVGTANNNATGVGLDPVMGKILALYPAPNSVNVDGITGTLFFPSESREKDEDATLKIDQKIGSRSNFSARYIYNWFHDPNAFHTDVLPGGIGAESTFQRTQSLALSLTTTLSNTMVNELRVSGNRTNLAFGCTGTDLFDSFGFIDGVGRGADYTFPFISAFGCQALGDSNGQQGRAGTYQYADTFTRVIGGHSVKFGAEFRDVYSNNFTDFGSRGTFTFNIFTASGVSPLQNLNANINSQEIEDISSMLLGLVNSQTQTQYFNHSDTRLPSDELDFRQRELGIFAQDQWKIRPNLTLTYGLRWEYYGVPFEAHGNMSSLFVDPSGQAPFTFVPVGPGTGHQLYDSYYGNFEPRVGFAWDPFRKGKTSIRGGIGVFSDRVYGNLVSDVRGNPPFQPSEAIPTILLASTFNDAQLSNQTAPGQFTPSPVANNFNPFTGTGAIFPDLFAHNIRPPSVVSYNFGVQHEFLPKTTLELNYVGNHATRILRVVDGNPPQPSLVNALVTDCAGSDACLSTLQNDLLYIGAEFGILPFDAVNNNAFFHTFTDQTSGHSWYDGLQAKVTSQARKGLQVGLSYTWSHALDDSSDPLFTTANNGNYPVDSLALFREKGNSGFDTRQRASINFIYQPGIGRGTGLLSHGILGRVFEGWEISGIAAFQTGLPYDIFGPLDTLHTGLADRATVTNPAELKTVPSTGKFFEGGVFTGFNSAAFNLEDGVSAPIPWGIPANVVRNNWYGPGVNNWDISLSKTMAVTEAVKFQFRFETYNLFNRVQFAKPASNVTNNPEFGYSFSQVGQNDGTTGARQIQLGAKILF